MSPQAWVVAFLLGGVVVVGWPVGLARRRWAMRTPVRSEPPESARPSRWDRAHWRSATATARVIARRRPGRTVALAAGVTAVCGWQAGGPVAAAVCGAYVGLATRLVLRRWANRDRASSRARTLDELGALAADLRAGLPPGTDPRQTIASPLADTEADSEAGSPAAASRSDERLLALTAAAWRLAERTGAPVADLVDRIEADARANDRGRASAAAQAAGARATALLLAGLPVGGIALGYAIGVDPLRVLLHTPLGAACAVGTLVLQFAGLAWSDRLAGAGARR